MMYFGWFMGKFFANEIRSACVCFVIKITFGHEASIRDLGHAIFRASSNCFGSGLRLFE